MGSISDSSRLSSCLSFMLASFWGMCSSDLRGWLREDLKGSTYSMKALEVTVVDFLDIVSL